MHIQTHYLSIAFPLISTCTYRPTIYLSHSPSSQHVHTDPHSIYRIPPHLNMYIQTHYLSIAFPLISICIIQIHTLHYSPSSRHTYTAYFLKSAVRCLTVIWPWRASALRTRCGPGRGGLAPQTDCCSSVHSTPCAVETRDPPL